MAVSATIAFAGARDVIGAYVLNTWYSLMKTLRMTVKSMQVVAAYSKIASADVNSICSVGPKKPLKPSTRSPRSASPPNSSATNALLVVALVIMYLE